MKDLQEATEKICELKGSLVAVDVLLTALCKALPETDRNDLLAAVTRNAEVARTVLLHAPISEHTLSAFERDIGRMAEMIRPL